MKVVDMAASKVSSIGTKKPLIFSFFSGAGFLDLGFEKAGFEIGFVNEIHKPFLVGYKHSRQKLGLKDLYTATLTAILRTV